jgi:hypothetical protein
VAAGHLDQHLVPWFLTVPNRIIRLAGVCLLALVPIQFAFFHADYFGDYAVRSAGWFGGNVSLGFDQLASRASAGSATIYLSDAMPFVEWHWRFFTIAHQRDTLLRRTVLVSIPTLDLGTAPRGSVLLLLANEPAREIVMKSGAVKEVAVIHGLDGSPFLVVLEKS